MKINLNVYHDVQQGGRQYMEDIISIVTNCDASKDTSNLTEKPFACFYVFDGHGGVDAAKFAEKNLHKIITSQEGFYSKDDDVVLKAIKSGFLITHKLMWDVLDTWPRTHMGNYSTSGTTASMVMIRDCKMYVAHVGDSGVVLGEEASVDQWKSNPITIDHKPDCPKEKQRIESIGGSVVIKAGVPRVVWKRQRVHSGLLANQPPTKEAIPFLAVARSLGDLWSYCEKNDGYYVSPEPDMSVYDIDPCKTRCIILASDGLWNAISPSDAVKLVKKCCDNSDELLQGVSRDPANLLVSLALKKCSLRFIKADNTSAIVVLINPPENGDDSSGGEDNRMNGLSNKSCDDAIKKRIACLPFSPLSNFSSCPSLIEARKSLHRSSSGVSFITSVRTFDDFCDDDYDSFEDEEDEEDEDDIDNNYIDFYEDEEEEDDDLEEKEAENDKEDSELCANVDDHDSNSVKFDAAKQNGKIVEDTEVETETMKIVEGEETTEVKKVICSSNEITDKTVEIHSKGEDSKTNKEDCIDESKNDDNCDDQAPDIEIKAEECTNNGEESSGNLNGEAGRTMVNGGNDKVDSHNGENKTANNEVNGYQSLKVRFMTKSRRLTESLNKNEKTFSGRPLVHKNIHSRPIRPLPQISHFIKKSPHPLSNKLDLENSLKENKASPTCKELDKNALAEHNLKQKSTTKAKSGASFFIGSARENNNSEDDCRQDFNLLELCKAAYDGLQTYNDKPTPQKPVCFLDSQTPHTSSLHRLTSDEKVPDTIDTKSSSKNQNDEIKDLKQQYTSIKPLHSSSSANSISTLRNNCQQQNTSLHISTTLQPPQINDEPTINLVETSAENISSASTFTKKCKNVAHKRKLGDTNTSPLRKKCRMSDDVVETSEVLSSDCIHDNDSTNTVFQIKNLQLNNNITKNEEQNLIKTLATSTDQTSHNNNFQSFEDKVDDPKDENIDNNGVDASIVDNETSSENISIEDKDNNVLLRVEACA